MLRACVEGGRYSDRAAPPEHLIGGFRPECKNCRWPRRRRRYDARERNRLMHAPLRRKLLTINFALILGLSVVGAALAWGIRSLRNDVASAASEYAELRLIEEAMYQASLARAFLDDDSRDFNRAQEHVHEALNRLQSFVEFQETEETAAIEHQ